MRLCWRQIMLLLAVCLITHTTSHLTVSLLFLNSDLTENAPYLVLLPLNSVATADKPVCSIAVQFVDANRILFQFYLSTHSGQLYLFSVWVLFVLQILTTRYFGVLKRCAVTSRSYVTSSYLSEWLYINLKINILKMKTLNIIFIHKRSHTHAHTHARARTHHWKRWWSSNQLFV